MMSGFIELPCFEYTTELRSDPLVHSFFKDVHTIATFGEQEQKTNKVLEDSITLQNKSHLNYMYHKNN